MFTIQVCPNIDVFRLRVEKNTRIQITRLIIFVNTYIRIHKIRAGIIGPAVCVLRYVACGVRHGSIGYPGFIFSPDFKNHHMGTPENLLYEIPYRRIHILREVSPFFFSTLTSLLEFNFTTTSQSH